MRKNEFQSKKNTRGQSSDRPKSDRSFSKGGRPSSARGTGTGSRGTGKSSFGERRDEGAPTQRRYGSDNETGFKEQNRSSDWSTGGYRVTKKAPAKSTGFKGYTKDENKEFRGGRSSEGRSSSEFRGRTSEGRRTSDSRGTSDFKGQRRGKTSDRYLGNRKEEGQGYRGTAPARGKTSEQGSAGYMGKRKDERPVGQGTKPFRGEKSQDFKGPGRRPGTTATHKGPRPGYVKKAPRLPAERRSSPKRIPDDYELDNNLIENQISDNTDREDRVEGRNSVFEAIRSGRPLNKLFVEKDSEDVLISRIIAMAREKDIPIQYLERKKLDTISQTRTHQGVILEVAAREYVEVGDILKIAEDKNEKPFILVLDGITDTNNLGSIIRSAECAGVHGIILPKRRSATLNATVAKVAAGALEYVPVARVTNLVQTLRSLKEEGVWVIGADMEGATDFNKADLTGPCALVIGSEGEGLARLVKDECDLMVKIPMKGKISSLNAGVAAALIMFEISNQRK